MVDGILFVVIPPCVEDCSELVVDVAQLLIVHVCEVGDGDVCSSFVCSHAPVVVCGDLHVCCANFQAYVREEFVDFFFSTCKLESRWVGSVVGGIFGVEFVGR